MIFDCIYRSSFVCYCLLLTNNTLFLSFCSISPLLCVLFGLNLSAINGFAHSGFKVRTYHIYLIKIDQNDGIACSFSIRLRFRHTERERKRKKKNDIIPEQTLNASWKVKLQLAKPKKYEFITTTESQVLIYQVYFGLGWTLLISQQWIIWLHATETQFNYCQRKIEADKKNIIRIHHIDYKRRLFVKIRAFVARNNIEH